MADADLEIICAQHREFPLHRSPTVVNIQCGRALTGLDLGLPADDSGANISALNPHFSELTAVYWYLENRTPARNIGICHYRRFFDPFALPLKRGDRWPIERNRSVEVTLAVAEFTRAPQTSRASGPLLSAALRTRPLILPRPMSLGVSIEEQFVVNHGGRGWALMLDVLHESGEHQAAAVFSSTYLFAWNMLIARRALFLDYAHWLFPILLEVHRRMDYDGLDAYQQRLPGFLAERLLTYYVVTRGLIPRARQMRIAQFLG
ncbi:MAG TPA: DUF4422 domain-containing protein [Propionibacteriaceae bacterium]|nr:DUF4422 domain-containing protein [Propionibacteriaceae bacterium]